MRLEIQDCHAQPASDVPPRHGPTNPLDTTDEAAAASGGAVATPRHASADASGNEHAGATSDPLRGVPVPDDRTEPLADGRRAHRPVTLYRLQLGGEMTFRAATALVPYLRALGVTDCYVSPILAARAGTVSGYDVCDHARLEPTLGTEEEFRAFATALREAALGLVLDVVPNHMAIDTSTNPWWRDVLENGPSSPFAHYFDIDWHPVKPELDNRVLLPILGDQYGAVLERGELKLSFDRGGLTLAYFEHRLPVNPRQAPLVFRTGLDQLREALGDDHHDVREFLSILTALDNLPVYTARDPALIVERQREKEVARERLQRLVDASAVIRSHVGHAVDVANGSPGRSESYDLLHQLLERQPYRLAYWRTAFDEINYRRFFDINDLAAIRVEVPEVFEHTHALTLRLIREGLVTGLRIDHPDGLYEPRVYFERLQQAVAEATRRHENTPHEAGTDKAAHPVYVVAEKILTGDEPLRTDWQVEGTTGYDFLNDVNGLFVHPENRTRLKRVYTRFTGLVANPAEEAYESKRQIMRTSLASELNVLGHGLNRLSEGDRHTRDFTLNGLRRALMEVVACLPVYRTYVSREGFTAEDAQIVDHAVGEAMRRNPVFESSIFSFLRACMMGGAQPSAETAASLPALPMREFALKVQQFSAAVQAKGLEDTAYYRSVALISQNEVGADPNRFGCSVERFHARNHARREQWPRSMVATATHDTKRGEDARARLNVLSEMPEEWHRAISTWKRLNAGLRTVIGGQPAPDRRDEYLFYQALLAAWPAEAEDAALPRQAPADLAARCETYMRKALREAKVHTSWLSQDEQYEKATLAFVRRSLSGPTAARFLAAFLPFARRVARLGVVNSLAQLALKLSAPGVADIYQGTESWDLAMVDPDNRRPVPFDERVERLAAVAPHVLHPRGNRSGEGDRDEGLDGRQALLTSWLDAWPDGRVKTFVTATGIALRRHVPEVIVEGEYVPLEVVGDYAPNVVASARCHGRRTLVTVVPRLAAVVTSRDRTFPLGRESWRTTRIVLPSELGHRFRDLVSGASTRVTEHGGTRFLLVGDVLASFPVAWLWSDAGAHTLPRVTGAQETRS